MLDIVEDLDEHFVFGDVLCMRRASVIVGTVVNDAVHVEVEAVEFGYTILCDEL